MKLIIIGASLSGKTTLVNFLRTKKIDCSEIDEELTSINGGIYPTDIDLKHNDLVPKIITKVITSPDIIFFSNTDYFTLDNLRQAKTNGFKIFQLNINLAELNIRNKNRVEKDGYEDMSMWLEDMVDYQFDLQKAGLVDQVLDATLPVEKLAAFIRN
jgi:guanylate kinase